MPTPPPRRFLMLLAVAVFAGVILGGALGITLQARGTTGAPPPSTLDPKVQHCLDAGGEPVRASGDLACLIPPATLERTP